MKHIFILNPKAGIKDNHLHHENLIHDYFDKNEGEYEIYVTEYAGHAKEIAKKVCLENSFVRIYSFGGDGTFNEVVTGAYSFQNCAIGIYPCGTGNDFVKTLNDGIMPSLQELISGREVVCDVINANGKIGVNICSTGFDGEVAKNVQKFKKYFTGNLAYTLSVFYCFLTKIKYDLRITIDDQKYDGQYIFAVAANGRYYGGGFFPAPDADISDGLLDFILIKTVSRMQILKLIGKYKDGSHIDLPITTVVHGKQMTVSSKKPLQLNIDGEVETVNEINLKIIPEALKLICTNMKKTKNYSFSSSSPETVNASIMVL